MSVPARCADIPTITARTGAPQRLRPAMGAEPARVQGAAAANYAVVPAGLPMFDTSPQLDCAGRILRLDRARVMGIVNVTPDSFSDGGAHDTTEAAVAHGLKLVEEGADLLDIGGESTRPGAAPVSVEEELRRVIPVIEQLAARTRCRSASTPSSRR
jgi:hypothetical protein